MDLLKQPASQLLPSEVVRSKFNCDLLPAYASSGCKSKTDPICPQGCVRGSSKGQSSLVGEEEDFRVGRSIVIPSDNWSLSRLGWVPGESQLNSPPSWFPPIAKNQQHNSPGFVLTMASCQALCHSCVFTVASYSKITNPRFMRYYEGTKGLNSHSPVPTHLGLPHPCPGSSFCHPGLVVWSVFLLGLCLFMYRHVHISETGQRHCP